MRLFFGIKGYILKSIVRQSETSRISNIFTSSHPARKENAWKKVPRKYIGSVWRVQTPAIYVKSVYRHTHLCQELQLGTRK